MRALAAQAGHLVVRVHLVELQDGELDLLPLVLDLLGLGVSLLLASGTRWKENSEIQLVKVNILRVRHRQRQTKTKRMRSHR